jgi:hypothetical protein
MSAGAQAAKAIFAPAGTAHRMEVPDGGKVRYIVFKTRK